MPRTIRYEDVDLTIKGKTIPATHVTEQRILYAGIDPGAKGGLFIFRQPSDVILAVETPMNEIERSNHIKTILKKYPYKKGWRYNFGIEKVHSMPKQGVASTFSFGLDFGVWRGLLSMAEISFNLIQPRAWQSKMFSKEHRKHSKKQMHLYAASQFFPRDTDKFKGPKGGIREGVCAAALIAVYNARENGGHGL